MLSCYQPHAIATYLRGVHDIIIYNPRSTMRRSIGTTTTAAAAALCLIVVSSSCTLCVVEAAAADAEPKQIRAAAAVKNTNGNNRIRQRASRGQHNSVGDVYRRGHHGAASNPSGTGRNRQLQEDEELWYDPDLHGDEGKHDISHARPADDGALDLSSPATANEVAEGRNADMNYDEVVVHAQVMPDEYRTESPTASPPVQGAAQRSPEANKNDLEGQGSSRDTDSGNFEAEICTSEVCFLESPEFNVAYGKCDGTDDPEKCIESSYLSWKDVMLGISLPDPSIGADDGTTNQPVGQFVTKNLTKNNRRKKNKKNKILGGLNDEQLIAAGTGVKGNTAFAATKNKRDRRKRKNNRDNKNNKKKMYWGDRRWKKQGKMPADVTLKIDDDMEMKLQLDLQELGLASEGDIPIDVVHGDSDAAGDGILEGASTGIKGASTSEGISSATTSSSTPSTEPERVPLDPVPEECRLARQIYDDAVAELIRCDEILIKKSHEMETSPMCTEGSGKFDAPACLGVLKQVRQDVDQVKRGVANERDEAKKSIDEYCYDDAYDFSAMPDRPNDVVGNISRGRSPDPLPALPSEAIGAVAGGPRAHSLNKDGATPQDPSDHQVHDDNHVFPGDASANDETKAALPISIKDRTNIDYPPEARTSSLDKAPSQDAQD